MGNRKINIAYWTVLVVMTIGILGSAVPGALKLSYAVEHFVTVLKLPEYLLVFTSLLKLAGLTALYIPGYMRIKEWVFAGFVFDLTGAWYCNFVATQSFTAALPVLIYLVILLLLYTLHRKRNQVQSIVNH